MKVRTDCSHCRCEDYCCWCDKSNSKCFCTDCRDYEKRLTQSEVKRVTELQAVWEYLYKNGVYEHCDTISREIGIIKGTIKENEEL
jgi:hypothetical protein